MQGNWKDMDITIVYGAVQVLQDDCQWSQTEDEFHGTQVRPSESHLKQTQRKIIRDSNSGHQAQTLVVKLLSREKQMRAHFGGIRHQCRSIWITSDQRRNGDDLAWRVCRPESEKTTAEELQGNYEDQAHIFNKENSYQRLWLVAAIREQQALENRHAKFKYKSI